MQTLPTTTQDLAGFWLFVRCGKCERSVRIHPAPHPLPRMPMVKLLDRLECKAGHCHGRAAYLELTLPDHGIPGAKDQYSPTWRMDNTGIWLERETANPFAV